MAHNPLIRILDALSELSEGGAGRVRGAVLEVSRLLARLGFQLVERRALGNGLDPKSQQMLTTYTYTHV